MAQPQKETILGNYTSFPRFPLDCESMEYIQENIKHLAIVAQIAGCDKLIIKGCTGNSQSRTEGYVYVRTGDDLVGEILYSPAGSGVRCGISTENINATANNETFTSAYTIRKLVSGTTGEWSWSDFRALSEITNAALKTLVDGKAAAGHNHTISEIINLQSTLNSKSNTDHTHNDKYYTQAQIDSKLSGASVAFVKGMIMMWSGAANTIPSGWALCNGRNGTPPLQDKFIVCAGSTYPAGLSGGSATHQHSASITLTATDIPAHRHRFSGDDRMNNKENGELNYSMRYGTGTAACGSSGTGDGSHFLTDDMIFNSEGKSGSRSDTTSIRFSTNDTSSLPPYYALCYIMKL